MKKKKKPKNYIVCSTHLFMQHYILLVVQFMAKIMPRALLVFTDHIYIIQIFFLLPRP